MSEIELDAFIEFVSKLNKGEKQELRELINYSGVETIENQQIFLGGK